jgi:hypothetical protein
VRLGWNILHEIGMDCSLENVSVILFVQASLKCILFDCVIGIVGYDNERLLISVNLNEWFLEDYIFRIRWSVNQNVIVYEV